MDKLLIPREVFVGRYIYYTQLLEKLGKIYLSTRNGKEMVEYYVRDSKTGKEKRRRITNKNKEWNKYLDWALKRKLLKERIKIMMKDYKEIWRGNLEEYASHYRIVPNTTNPHNNEMFYTFTNNQGGVTDKHKFQYKGIPMRSEFETEIASIIDDMDITFKYEVKLHLSKHCRFPDFALLFPEYNRCAFLEYLGGLGSFQYVSDNSEKFEEYHDEGLYISRDIMFLPGDVNYRPDKQMIRETIMTMYAAIARMHLVRVN